MGLYHFKVPKCASMRLHIAVRLIYPAIKRAAP